MSITDKSEIIDTERPAKRLCGINPLADIDASFAIVAVRCNSNESTGKRKLIPGTIYYLLDGYSVESDETVSSDRHDLNCLYDDYMVDDASEKPHIQISAIVGQNGSGKSSIVEFIMRLINNFAAATFGEWKFGKASERLHFIDGVSGDLWYVSDNHLYHLSIANHDVELFLCGDIRQNGSGRREYALFGINQNGESSRLRLKGRCDEAELRRLFDHFFYTLVSNYSLYAYNSNDFRNECDPDEKEQLVRASYPDEKFNPEQRCWLNGLFHKNDGYQTPMVITPFRHEGNIDINNENDLARERLISLLIRNKESRKINDHLEAVGLSVRPAVKKDYGIKAIRKYLEFGNLQEKGYEVIKSIIVDMWGDAAGHDLTVFSSKPHYESAIEYLVYKTLKISYTYRQHRKDYDLLKETSDVFNPELVKDIVNSQIKDLSHVTRKIRQTLAYLIYDVYSDFLGTDRRQTVVPFEEIERLWRDRVFPTYRKSRDFLRSALKAEIVNQTLMPPPFLTTSLQIREISADNIEIDFETLSSGEKQQIFAISSILYHLNNLESVADDKSDPYRIPYRNVFIILEEIELYFHPELQQKFIRQLLDGIKQLNLCNIKAMHLLLVTHSPYVLSDIPKGNVLALTKDGCPADRKLKTFCGNIHEILKDSFFLSHGSQGDFAQWEIGHLMACLQIHKNYLAAYRPHDDRSTDKEDWPKFIDGIIGNETDAYSFARRYISHDKSKKSFLDYDAFNLDFSEDKLRKRISVIDEPLVRSVLMMELEKVFARTEEERRAARIKELEEELHRLKNC
ncbi:MAG: AAA family ATPase [Bacteroidales bacterium]|nr:AAA family ATPase [Bacteroidales bacterium]